MRRAHVFGGTLVAPSCIPRTGTGAKTLFCPGAGLSASCRWGSLHGLNLHVVSRSAINGAALRSGCDGRTHDWSGTLRLGWLLGKLTSDQLHGVRGIQPFQGPRRPLFDASPDFNGCTITHRNCELKRGAARLWVQNDSRKRKFELQCQDHRIGLGLVRGSVVATLHGDFHGRVV